MASCHHATTSSGRLAPWLRSASRSADRSTRGVTTGVPVNPHGKVRKTLRPTVRFRHARVSAQTNRAIEPAVLPRPKCERREAGGASPQWRRRSENSRPANGTERTTKRARSDVSQAGCRGPRGSELEAPPGFEPGMEVLQTSALPLGDGAGRNSIVQG